MVNKFKVDSLLLNTDFNLHPYYKKSIENYGKNFNETNIYNFDYKVIEGKDKIKEFFNLDYQKYMEKIDKLSKIYNKFEASNTTPDGKVFSKRLCSSQIKSNIGLINEIYDILLPGIEKNIYSSNVKVIDINAYQNTICKSEKKISSWLWHFDNHPNEFIKIMIYLTDVDENSGPLELMVNKNNEGCKLKSNRIKKEDFFNRKQWDDPKYFRGQYNGNRISDRDIRELVEKGYNQRKILGKKGTVIMFSENLIHRANYATKNFRNILNTVISPSLDKKNKIYNVSLFI